MEINLDGGEVQVLKAIGLGGTTISGEQLIERVPGVDEAELIDTIKGLMMMGYIITNKQSFHSLEDVERSEFHVNSGYARDLKEAMDPNPNKKTRSRRVRRE